MNERIKELAEQAGFYFYDMHDVDGQDLGETIEADSWTAAEKFAELIVRECAELCLKYAEYENPFQQMEFRKGHHFNTIIKNHFGVKE